MTQHFKYAAYLSRHKWFVFVAGLKTKAPLWRLLIHDWSKFLPCEWMPYADYFYGRWSKTEVRSDHPGWACGLCAGKARAEQAFDRAWLHHQHTNPHHWQHWVLREDSGATKLLVIPEHFVREMVADWMGAGRAITGKWDAATWYRKNRDKILLEDATRELTESILQQALGEQQKSQEGAGK